jgi:hypothetical protein
MPGYVNRRENDPIPELPEAERAYTEAVIVHPWTSSMLAGATYSPDEWIRNNGYAKLDEMTTLAQYSAPLKVKKCAALYKKEKVLPAVTKVGDKDYDKAQEIAEFCEYALNAIYDPETTEWNTPSLLLWNLMDAVHRGHALLSCEYRTEDSGKWKGKWLLKRFTSLHPDNLGFWLNPHNLRLEATYYRSVQGYLYELPLERCLLYTHDPKDSLPYGEGDGRSCYKHAFYLLEGMRWFGIDVERWAAGVLLAQTNNTSVDYMNKLLEEMAKMRQGTDGVFPKEPVLQILQKGVSSHNVFQAFFLEHRSAIVTRVLGQSLTTGVQDGKGSYALGDIQEGTQEFIFSELRKGLERVIKYQLFARLVRWNFGNEYLYLTPSLSLGSWNTAEKKALADFYHVYKDFGSLEPTEEWIREEFGLPPQGAEIISAA